MDAGRRSVVVVCEPEDRREELRGFAMAAALLGVRLRPINDFVETRRLDSQGNEIRHVAWFLECADAAWKYKTHELWNHWRDPEWITKNKEHPLAVLREYWEALRDARAHEEQAVPLAVKVKDLGGGRKRALQLPLDIDPERKRKFLEMFNEC